MSNTHRRSVILAIVGMAASRLSATQKETGPYCWAGKKDGKDVYIPCGSKNPSATIEKHDWLTIDLSEFAGLRVVFGNDTYYLTKGEISTALSDAKT